MLNSMTQLLNKGTVTDQEHGLRIGSRNLVLELGSVAPVLMPLTVKGGVSRDPNTHSAVLVSVEIALGDTQWCHCAPVGPSDEELPLYFGWLHDPLAVVRPNHPGCLPPATTMSSPSAR